MNFCRIAGSLKPLPLSSSKRDPIPDCVNMGSPRAYTILRNRSLQFRRLERSNTSKSSTGPTRRSIRPSARAATAANWHRPTYGVWGLFLLWDRVHRARCTRRPLLVPPQQSRTVIRRLQPIGRQQLFDLASRRGECVVDNAARIVKCMRIIIDGIRFNRPIQE